MSVIITVCSNARTAAAMPPVPHVAGKGRQLSLGQHSCPRPAGLHDAPSWPNVSFPHRRTSGTYFFATTLTSAQPCQTWWLISASHRQDSVYSPGFMEAGMATSSINENRQWSQLCAQHSGHGRGKSSLPQMDGEVVEQDGIRMVRHWLPAGNVPAKV